MGKAACWKKRLPQAFRLKERFHSLSFPASLCVPRREVALRTAGVIASGQSAGRGEMRRTGGEGEGCESMMERRRLVAAQDDCPEQTDK